MIGVIFLSFLLVIGIFFMWKFKKFVENRDLHALEQEVELDFKEELLENNGSEHEHILGWLEDEQIADTIIQMNSKK